MSIITDDAPPCFMWRGKRCWDLNSKVDYQPLPDARVYISTAWWMPLFAGLCFFITILGINLLGDAMRDLLDPR